MAVLFDLLAPLVLRLTRALLRDEVAAQEAVVSTFVQVWRQAPSFAGRTSVTAWVLELAARRAVSLSTAGDRYAG